MQADLYSIDFEDDQDEDHGVENDEKNSNEAVAVKNSFLPGSNIMHQLYQLKQAVLKSQVENAFVIFDESETQFEKLYSFMSNL